MKYGLIAGIAALAAAAGIAQGVITLAPGSVIGQDSGAPGGGTFTMVRWNMAGVFQESLAVTGVPGGYGTMDGVAVIGNELWTVGTGGIVARVNTTTGAMEVPFSSGMGSVEALGNFGADLLVADFGSGAVGRYTTGGALVTTYTVGTGATGIDSDGVNLYTANYGTGMVEVYSLAGALLSSFSAGPAFSVSGLGVDSTNGDVWVSHGFGSGAIERYSSAGALLGSFPSGYPFIDGLDVIPIPAPGVLGLGAVAGLAALRRRR